MRHAIAILTVLGLTSAAQAQSADQLTPPSLVAPTAPEPRAPASRWYGNETLLVDAASLGLAAVSLVTDADLLALIGLGGMWLGTPIVHLSHGEGGRAALSFLALRPGLFVLGAYLGANAEDCSGGEEWCGLAGLFWGALAGVGAASIVDATIAYELNVAPIVLPQGRGAGTTYGLGVAGAF